MLVNTSKLLAIEFRNPNGWLNLRFQIPNLQGLGNRQEKFDEIPISACSKTQFKIFAISNRQKFESHENFYKSIPKALTIGNPGLNEYEHSGTNHGHHDRPFWCCRGSVRRDVLERKHLRMMLPRQI